VDRLSEHRVLGPARSLLTAIGLSTVVLLTGCAARPPDYWPTEGWRTSTPEEQGMDSDQLARFLEYVEERDIEIRSVVIARNGYIGLDDVHRVGHCERVGELFKREGGYWSGPTWTEIGARGRWESEDTFVVTLMPLEGVLDYLLGVK
jgi:hypothetical protein